MHRYSLLNLLVRPRGYIAYMGRRCARCATCADGQPDERGHPITVSPSPGLATRLATLLTGCLSYGAYVGRAGLTLLLVTSYIVRRLLSDTFRHPGKPIFAGKIHLFGGMA